MKPVEKKTGLVAVRRLALGVVAAAGSLMLVAPMAHAAPQDDARGAIEKVEKGVADGSIDKGALGTGLGDKEGEVTAAGDGFEQKYGGGTVYWSDKTDAHVLYGGINEKYSAVGGPTGDVGFPKSDEKVADAPEGARYAEFAADDNPRIYWTPEAGAWLLRGPFASAFGDADIAKALGMPKGDAVVNGDQITQEFANGTLTFDAKTGKWINIPNLPGLDLKGKLDGLKWALPFTLPGWPKINLPGMPNIDLPNVNLPNVNVPKPSLPSISGPDTSKFNWWWLLLPLLIIGGLLLLSWLWRLLTGKGRKAHLHSPDLHVGDAVDAVKGAGGKVAAGAAGAAGAVGAAASAAGDKVKGAAGSVADAAETAGGKVRDGVEGLLDDGKSKGAAGAAGAAAAAGAAGTWVRDGKTVPVPKGAHLPLPGNAEPKGYPIKGNADSGLYHTPESRAYKATIAEIWFATEADAKAAGFKKFE
ncbi:MAG: hypothetical protein QM728_02995 [Gordonia sp. (in: high G+C Gram-positive bacteria)]|uniref:LGFP repeat-containing protein n=1 Tax=Gordonia sp. (in: high G+C Gram-positive bacteria) TaxID=84139 RepID=UPI0039E47539